MDSAPCSINVGGRLMGLDEPRVMGIVNLTPDSFYAASRAETDGQVARCAERMMAEGADILDVGACSTRPGSAPASESEEAERLRRGLAVLRRVAPDVPMSVDTFRPSVARLAVEEFGVDIVNDVSGGADPAMFDAVAKMGVPYVLTHAEATEPGADLLTSVLQFFARQAETLHEKGVKDIILDPGFGFGKTLGQNYELMARLDDLRVLNLPLLVGISRKSMIHRLLDCPPEEALGGTIALNMVALTKGASILRVHDVRQAVETVKIYKQLCWYSE